MAIAEDFGAIAQAMRDAAGCSPEKRAFLAEMAECRSLISEIAAMAESGFDYDAFAGEGEDDPEAISGLALPFLAFLKGKLAEMREAIREEAYAGGFWDDCEMIREANGAWRIREMPEAD